MTMISDLGALLDERGVDQKTVAADTGLNPNTVGKLKRGHFDRIDTRTIQQLCKYFGLKSIADLIEIQWETDDTEGVQT